MGEMVTITAAEYQALLGTAENFADLRAYDRAMAAIAGGRRGTHPPQHSPIA